MTDSSETKGFPRTGGLRRMLALKLGMSAFFLVVALRLVQIQLLEARKYQEIARKQSEVKVSLPAARGYIFDRNHAILVSNAMMPSLGADPKMIAGDAGSFASRLAGVFDRPKSYYLEKLQEDRHFVWLERRVKPQQASVVNALQFEGTVQLEEPRRLYPYDQLAGQVIGFTDVDNVGISGIELECNDILQGHDGWMTMQRDALGRRRNSVDYPRFDPVNGRDVVLTIDVVMQGIAEEELRRGVEQTGSDGGLVIMLDPKTGEILAMAAYPSVNPNDATGATEEARRDRSITDMFEPGSVFKLVTASAALEHHLVSLSQKFNAEQGRYVVALKGRKTRIITDTHTYGLLTFQQAFELSSNIVMAKVSNTIGAERLYTTARNFGFGTETGIDLPGEVRGELKKPTEWSGTTLNSMAYGYEVGVTPIQIACAYAAVANNGVLMRPFIVRQLLDEDGRVVRETKPQVVRTVISKETVKTLTTLLEGVVQRGTGTSAKLEGLAIAGKTGTSRKYLGGHYEAGSYTASFAGFFPSTDPRLVCVVMMNNPKIGGYYGGTASAPVFRSIAQKVFATSARFVQPNQIAAQGKPYVVPDVTMLTVETAQAVLSGEGFTVIVQGNGGIVQAQSPVPGTHMQRGDQIKLSAASEQGTTVPAGFVVVPDLKGLSMRRALNRLISEQLDGEVAGSGIVAGQSPSAGSEVKLGTRVTVRCEARSIPIILN
jgi:cell division protein FtsI (penicillin-binding protein 3)